MSERDEFAETVWIHLWPSGYREWDENKNRECPKSKKYTRADLAAEREDALQDRLDDALSLIQIAARSMGVVNEPHQTFHDRFLCAAKHADPKASENAGRERERELAILARDLYRAVPAGWWHQFPTLAKEAQDKITKALARTGEKEK